VLEYNNLRRTLKRKLWVRKIGNRCSTVFCLANVEGKTKIPTHRKFSWLGVQSRSKNHPQCASQKLVPYISVFATSFHFYFTCEVELSVVPVLSFSCATHVRLSMLIGWHSNRVICWLPFSREWRCERVGPRCESFLRLIRAVTVGYLTARLIYWLIDSLWITCWATGLRGLRELRCDCLRQ